MLSIPNRAAQPIASSLHGVTGGEVQPELHRGSTSHDSTAGEYRAPSEKGSAAM